VPVTLIVSAVAISRGGCVTVCAAIGAASSKSERNLFMQPPG
jgi:hypothetical protein